MPPPPIPDPEPMDSELYEHLKEGLRQLFDYSLNVACGKTNTLLETEAAYARVAPEVAQALIALETLQLRKQQRASPDLDQSTF